MTDMVVGKIAFGPKPAAHLQRNSVSGRFIGGDGSATFHFQHSLKEVYGAHDFPIDISVISTAFDGNVPAEKMSPRIRAALEELAAAILETNGD